VLKSDDRAAYFSFRDNAIVQDCLKMFAFVELVEVKVFVGQLTVLAAKSGGTKLVETRFGIVPRDTTYQISTGAGSTATVTGYVSRIPHLASIMSSTNVPTTASVRFGPGGTPFPPGLQLDLRPLETRFNWPVFFIGNVHVRADDPVDLWNVQVEFTVECWGEGFGNPN